MIYDFIPPQYLEHKSYKPTHPHFQLLDYIRGAWRLEAGENKRPTVIVPIVHQIIEKVNYSDNNLKSKVMSIFDEIEQKGIEKGIKKGKIEGKIEEKRSTIIRSWENGISISMISNISGLSILDIEKVIADYQAKT